MLDSPDLDVPQFDDASLDVLLRRTLRRSTVLRSTRARHRTVVAALTGAVVVTGVVVALPGSVSHPSSKVAGPGLGSSARGSSSQGSSSQGSSSQGSSASGSGGQWRLVDDVTDVASWGTVTADGFEPTLALTCPAVGTCFADADGQIEYTHDGGATWKQASGVSTTAMADDISCVDAEQCSVMGPSASGGTTYFTTTDGGANWTSQPGPPRISLVGFTTKLSCWSSTACLAAGVEGESTMSAIPASQPSVVFVTSDGGATWTEESTLPTGLGPLVLSCHAPGVCIVSGLASGTPNTVYVSTDGGATWTAATLPAGAGPLQSMSCPTSSDCVATAVDGGDPGAGGLLLDSSDGGMTWGEESATGLPSSLLDTVSCASATECWLGGVVRPAGDDGPAVLASDGQGLLAWSSDGGSTWHQASVPQGVGPINSVTCPDTSTCYALGFEPSAAAGQNVPIPGRVALLSTSRP